MDLKSFTQAIQQIADEKGIAKEKIAETIEMALAAAYKRDYGKRGQIIRATLDPDTGQVVFRQIKIVVDQSMLKPEEELEGEKEIEAEIKEETETKKIKDQELMSIQATKSHDDEDDEDEEEEKVFQDNMEEKKVRFNPEKHLMIEEARKIKSSVEPGEELEFPLDTHDSYGRIAAQTAKQVILQRIREAERESIFDEYKAKEGELVSGIIQRIEGRNIFVDLGRTMGILTVEEQIPHERYNVGERFKSLITFAEKNPKGPGIFLSRSHPRLLKKLFELEVPEISTGAVEIKALAREPGSRSKVSVISNEEGVDPVGSLVGQKGVRVSTVMQELSGEKIDIVEWAEDTAELIANSLSPAKVIDVQIEDRRKEAVVFVSPDQFSLAIGKGGQNVRLAAKLTGWKIDVRQDNPQQVDGTIEAQEPKEEIEKNIEKDTPPIDTNMNTNLH